MTKKKIYVVVTALLLVACLSIGATAAYMTDGESVENNFSYTYAGVKVEEPNWNDLPASDKVAYPGRTIVKDPYVVNSGEIPLYIFMEVKIPKVVCRTVGADGVTLSSATEHQLLSYTALSPWIRLDKDDSALDYDVYVYGYCGGIVEPGAATSKLFTSVNVIDFVEGDIALDTLDMPIRAFGIQSDYLEVSSTGLYEQMKEIYLSYKDVLQD